MALATKNVIITGANRGIGLAILERFFQHECAFKIVMACRNAENAKESLSKLQQTYPGSKQDVQIHQLDITDSHSIDGFSDWYRKKYDTLDLLINNAGVGHSTELTKAPSLDKAIVDNTMNTNFYGTVNLTEKLFPLLRDDGKVISVSTLLAKLEYCGKDLQEKLSNPDTSLKELHTIAKEFEEATQQGKAQERGFPGSSMKVSKTLLNAYNRWVLSKMMVENQNCNVFCPGWCRTNVGGPHAARTAERGADTALYLADLPYKRNPKFHGKFFHERKEMEY